MSNIITRIIGATEDATEENDLANLFDQRAAAVAKLQATIQQLAGDLKSVSDITDQLWRELPARPQALPLTFGPKFRGLIDSYLYGQTDGAIGKGGSINAYVTRQRVDLVKCCAEDRATLEAMLKREEAA